MRSKSAFLIAFNESLNYCHTFQRGQSNSFKRGNYQPTIDRSKTTFHTIALIGCLQMSIWPKSTATSIDHNSAEEGGQYD